MRLDIFLHKKVYIVTTYNFTYVGQVLEAEEDSILILDKKGEAVYLKSDSIANIREVVK